MPEITSTPVSEADRAAALRETLADLGRYDRRGFRHLLAEFIGAKPTAEALAAFAARYPDRWAQGIAILAALAGFERGVNVNVNVRNVGALSDAELMGLAEAMRARLAAEPPPIDVTPRSVTTTGATESLPDAGSVAGNEPAKEPATAAAESCDGGQQTIVAGLPPGGADGPA